MGIPPVGVLTGPPGTLRCIDNGSAYSVFQRSLAVLYRLTKPGTPTAGLKGTTLASEGWKEKDLENVVSKVLAEIVRDELYVVAQSRQGKADVDILALDAAGEAWFFELKRAGGKSEDLLQAMRYSQTYSTRGISEFDALSEEDSESSLFSRWCKHFGHDESRFFGVEHEIGRKHHLVIVTDGADDETYAAVAHWRRHGLDVRTWPYRLYSEGQGTFLLEFPDLEVGSRRIGQREPSTFFVNTNRRYHPKLQDAMMKEHAAMATEFPWIDRVEGIPVGAIVVLYENGVGIVATGIATASRTRFQWSSTGERIEPAVKLKLREFARLQSPMTMAEVKKIVGNRVFNATVHHIKGDAGKRLAEEIRDRAS